MSSKSVARQLALAIVIAGMAPGVVIASSEEDAFFYSVSVRTSKPSYRFNENLIVTVSVKNLSNKTLWISGPEYDGPIFVNKVESRADGTRRIEYRAGRVELDIGQPPPGGPNAFTDAYEQRMVSICLTLGDIFGPGNATTSVSSYLYTDQRVAMGDGIGIAPRSEADVAVFSIPGKYVKEAFGALLPIDATRQAFSVGATVYGVNYEPRDPPWTVPNRKSAGASTFVIITR